MNDEESDYIVLKLPDHRNIRIIGNEVEIINSGNGSVMVNGHKMALDAVTGGVSRTARLSVPRGKRARVTLADGSVVWVNSGTKLRYPLKFEKDFRYIYAEGEVFLNVTKDPSHPFIAETRGFDVKVYGTSFNLSAYPSDSIASVVLVGGSVKVAGKGNEDDVSMKPGELVNIKGSDAEMPRKVNVDKYVSWVDNLLVYDNEPLREVFNRLSTMTGKEFVLGKGVSVMRVSGKLDLKEGLGNVLSTISFAAPVRFEERDEKIYVSKI